MYKALKEGWLPYNLAFEKYIKIGDKRRFINKVPKEYKEQISRVWFVNGAWFENINIESLNLKPRIRKEKRGGV